VTFSPSKDNILASCGVDKKIIIWNLQTMETMKIFEGTDSINVATWHPNSSMVATGATDGKIQLWSLADSTKEVNSSVTSHTKNVNALLFTPDGRFLISGSHDKTVRLWEIKDNSLQHATMFPLASISTSHMKAFQWEDQCLVSFASICTFLLLVHILCSDYTGAVYVFKIN
jgi:WD40 repeat protein